MSKTRESRERGGPKDETRNSGVAPTPLGELEALAQENGRLRERLASLEQASDALRADLRAVVSRVADIPCVIVAVDRRHNVTFLNRAVQGVPPRAVVGRDASRFFSDVSAKRVREAIDYVFRTARSVDVEVETKPGRDATPRRYRARLGPAWYGADVTSVMAVALDVTELSHAEHDFEQLAFSRETAVERERRAGPATIWTTDVELHLTSLRNSNAPVGSVPPPDRRRVDEILPFADSEAHQRALRGETVVAEAHGSSGEHRVTLRPMRGPDGSTVGVVGVAECTGALSARAEEIEQAQKMEALGRITGGIAHDFNNLLTAMFGYVGLLERRYEDASAPRELRELQNTATRATGLVRQLIQFARRRAADPAVIDVGETVLDMEDMLRCVVGDDVALCVASSSEPAFCVGDRSQLEQVVMNLVINAREAITGAGTIDVEVNVVSGNDAAPRVGVTAADRLVVLSVRDTGHGIDDAVRSAMFEPFFTTRGNAGTGLGLPTVAQIVDRFGGWIDVHSEHGHGATMSVWMPAVAAPRVSDVPTLDSPWPMGSESVLIVDNDRWVRESTAEVLRVSGYRVTVAEDGEHALAILDARGEPFDLVLTDALMPRMAGPELVEELARRYPSLRVVIVSGRAASDECSHLPAIRFLAKPYTPRRLAVFVRDALDA